MHLQDNPRLQLFSVDAMNTTFTIRVDHPDSGRAGEAASACFNRLEELEGDLSRFRPDSDVSRINRLGAGESLYISAETHACLLKAAEAQAMTAGLFNATVGAHTWHQRDTSRSEGPAQASSPAAGQEQGCLEIAPDRPQVTCKTPGREVDLGGIGKGFALDQLAEILGGYGLESCLLCAGASTLLARGPAQWPVELAGDRQRMTVGLQGRALSASGTGLQGAHVVHPDAPGEAARYAYSRVWVLAPEAALADACSTACLLMSGDEAACFAEAYRDSVMLYVLETGSTDVRLMDAG